MNDCIQGASTNCPTVAGNIIMDEAKIGGITPAVLILRGRYVLCPPYIFLPTTRLAYCTGSRRWPRSMNTIKPITRTMKIKTLTPQVIYCLFKENHLYMHNTTASVAIPQFSDKERFHRLKTTLRNLNSCILSLESQIKLNLQK